MKFSISSIANLCKGFSNVTKRVGIGLKEEIGEKMKDISIEGEAKAVKNTIIDAVKGKDETQQPQSYDKGDEI